MPDESLILGLMCALVDLHVHSIASPCSVLTANTVAAEALARGLDGVAVVDHDRFPDPSFLTAVRDQGMPAWSGVEISTPDGDLLLFGVVTLPPPGLAGTEVLRWSRECGGAAVAAHPFRRSRPCSPSLIEHRELPLECANGRCTPEENRSAHRVWIQRGGASTGGSDAHQPGEVGTFATRFERLPADGADLAALLRAGRCEPCAPGAARQRDACVACAP